MKTLSIQEIIDKTLFDEVKKTIINESETKEMYQITCENEPVEVFYTEEDANKHLDIYKKKHPEKEFIIEKIKHNSMSEMIDKLDEMGEKLETKENKDMKKFKAKNLADAIMDAYEKGINKIKVNGESYDVKEMYSELEEAEGVCDECGYSMEEELLGNQKKIDANKNGKIDADDFKKLRSKKKEMDEESDMDENAFVLAADAARDAGKKEFEFPKGSGKMHKVTLKKDISTEEVNEQVDSSMVDEICTMVKEKMMEEKDPCGDYSDEFEFADNVIANSVDLYMNMNELEDEDVYNSLFNLVKDECGDEVKGYYTKYCSEEGDFSPMDRMYNSDEWVRAQRDVEGLDESKKKTLRLTESEMIGLIEKIVKKTKTIKESVPGLQVTKKVQSDSKKENDDYMKDLEKKLKDYSTFDGNDNPEFPKQIGKGEKMAIQNTEEQNDDLNINRGGGMQDLDYDYEPSEQFKKRLKMALEGDPKMGNSQEAANVIKSKTGENISKITQKKKEAIKKEKQISWGHSWMTPEDVKTVNESKKEDKNILEEEIKRMKNIAGYDKKTQ